MAETPTTTSTPVAAAATAPKNVIHLSPLLPIASLPYHPTLSEAQTESSCPPLASFAAALLSEAQTFLTSTRDKSLSAKGKKTADGSTAPITVFKGTVNGEFWVGRSSEHAGKAENGDGTFEEFDAGLRVEHSKHEMDYTPGVVDAVKICEWEAVGLHVDGWKDTTLTVLEMQHRLPAPLKPRVFTIVILTASSATSPKPYFVTATLPLPSLRGITSSKYANGATANTVVHAAYASVERVHQHEDGKVVWEMYTASDAKGALPMSVQKLGIVGAIVKDVGLFLTWVAKNRKS